MQFKTDGVSWKKAKTTTIPSRIYSSVTDGIQPFSVVFVLWLKISLVIG